MISAILTSKWMICIYVVLAIVIILLIICRKSVHSEITIKTSAYNVWNVLTNTDDYKNWNSVMLLVDGEVKEGNTAKYQFTQEESKSYEIPSKVIQVIPSKLLNQAGGTIGILTFNHNYILEDLNGNTKLIIHEDYRGVMVPFWNPNPVQKAYERLNRDIKKKAESLNQ